MIPRKARHQCDESLPGTAENDSSKTWYFCSNGLLFKSMIWPELAFELFCNVDCYETNRGRLTRRMVKLSTLSYAQDGQRGCNNVVFTSCPTLERQQLVPDSGLPIAYRRPISRLRFAFLYDTQRALFGTVAGPMVFQALYQRTEALLDVQVASCVDQVRTMASIYPYNSRSLLVEVFFASLFHAQLLVHNTTFMHVSAERSRPQHTLMSIFAMASIYFETPYVQPAGL